MNPGREAIAQVHAKPYFKACVRKAIQIFNTEALKARKADAAKITATCGELNEAMTGDAPSLGHKAITGQFLHDVCVLCVEAEDAIPIVNVSAQTSKRDSDSERPSSETGPPRLRIDRTPSAEVVASPPKGSLQMEPGTTAWSAPIVAENDPLKKIHALIGLPGAMKLSAEFCSEIRMTRDSAVNRVHVEAWKRVVKGSVEERVVAKVLRKGAGEVDVEATVGPLFDGFDVYMLLLPMAVDFLMWSGKKEGEKHVLANYEFEKKGSVSSVTNSKRKLRKLSNEVVYMKYHVSFKRKHS